MSDQCCANCHRHVRFTFPEGGFGWDNRRLCAGCLVALRSLKLKAAAELVRDRNMRRAA